VRLGTSAGMLMQSFLIIACGDGGGSTSPIQPSPPPAPPPAATVATVTIAPTQVTSGQTTQLTATAKSSTGSVISGRIFEWSSDATLIAAVSGQGSVRGVSVGTATIAARDQLTGITGTLQLPVTASARRAGSYVGIGTDSVLQFESYVLVSTIGIVDTAAAGSDQRIGIARASSANPNPSISRSLYPLLAAVAECTNGNVYAFSFSTLNGPRAQLWRVDPGTALLTLLGTVDIAPNVASDMTCDGTNNLLLVGNFAGFGQLIRLNPVTREFSTGGLVFEPFSGIAQSPVGVVYATTYDRNSQQILVTVNTLTGAVANVPAAQRQSSTFAHLFFRGGRLLGFSNSRLIELNPSSGVVTQIRNAKIP
jgi:hypothetical protein